MNPFDLRDHGGANRKLWDLSPFVVAAASVPVLILAGAFGLAPVVVLVGSIAVGSRRSKVYQAVLWDQYRRVWAPQRRMSVLVTVGGRGVRAQRGPHTLTVADGMLTIDGPRVRCQFPAAHVEVKPPSMWSAYLAVRAGGEVYKLTPCVGYDVARRFPHALHGAFGRVIQLALQGFADPGAPAGQPGLSEPVSPYGSASPYGPAHAPGVPAAPQGPSHAPPPDWYPDPANPARRRWWDGQQWTGHVDPPEPSGPAGPPGRPY